MKRFATAAVSMTIGLMAIPSTAAAQTCEVGQEQAICQQLADCYAIGAIFLPRSDAVPYYRQCLFLDRRYKLNHPAETRAPRRARVLPRGQSTFFPLYCVAQEYAGNPNLPFCRARNTQEGDGGGGGGGRERDGRTAPRRAPRFTG